MNENNEYKILETMRQFGGSFVSGLSELYQIADVNNREKLKIAFGDIFDKYEKMAKRIK